MKPVSNIKTRNRLLAVVLLATAIVACFEAWHVVRYGDAAGAADSKSNGLALLLLATFLIGAVASFLGARSVWGQSNDPAAPRSTPLFGRNAHARPDGGTRSRFLFLALPVIVLAAAGVNHALPRRAPPQGDVVAVQPDEPPPPQDIAAVPEPPPQPPVTTAPLPEPVPLPADASGHRNSVVWLDVSQNGRMLLSASTDKAMKLWDLEEKRLIRDLGAHKDMARTALFMPDGTHALSAGDDGEIVLRALADGSATHVFDAGQNGGVNKLAISPDGRRAVTGHDSGNLIVWDLEKRTALHVLTGHAWSISSVAVSPDGARALSSSIDGELRLWDIEPGRLLRRWQGHERGAYGAVFTADGKQAYTGSGDLTIKLWELDTGKEVSRFTGHSGTIYALVLSDDDGRLLSASLDGSARLWDTANGEQIAMFDPGTGPIHSVAFAGNDFVLTGGIDRTIRRWSIDAGEGDILFAGAPE